jgi:hypothetical protein
VCETAPKNFQKKTSEKTHGSTTKIRN